jgi:hypothetical protein
VEELYHVEYTCYVVASRERRQKGLRAHFAKSLHRLPCKMAFENVRTNGTVKNDATPHIY